ncbi:MAG TPA: isocitrate lyase/phosphoenolpyruvate mutase family protein [Ktedonobacteraceae bacterium]|nr:isocitrate lyase/phosphoenolpyruvate mutase family protein [Ktedonobacteraceae bacterium]
MNSILQKEQAERFRQFHHQATPLILPNIWDAASARVIEQAGFKAVATSSSALATALGYSDGQQISRDLLSETLARITRIVECPVTADIEAGYGNSIEEVLQTVKAVIEAGGVGLNIEDSQIQNKHALVDTSYQVELIQALRELAVSIEIPFVINARVDVLLRAIGEPENRLEHTIQRANAYLQAGADCIYPIGLLDRETISSLVQEINGPINILGGSPQPTLPELGALGVARVSLASGPMRSVLGHLRLIAQELLEYGTYTSLGSKALSNLEFGSLFKQ